MGFRASSLLGAFGVCGRGGGGGGALGDEDLGPSILGSRAGVWLWGVGESPGCCENRSTAARWHYPDGGIGPTHRSSMENIGRWQRLFRAFLGHIDDGPGFNPTPYIEVNGTYEPIITVLITQF